MSGKPRPGTPSAEEALAARIAEAHGLLRDLRAEIRVVRAIRDELVSDVKEVMELAGQDVAPMLNKTCQGVAEKFHRELAEQFQPELTMIQRSVDAMNAHMTRLAGFADPDAARDFVLADVRKVAEEWLENLNLEVLDQVHLGIKIRNTGRG